MCGSFGVSESGYYAWRKRAPSRRVQRDVALTVAIRDSHERSDSSNGAPRIFEELRAAGHRAGQKRVARLMRREDLLGVSKRRGATRLRQETPDEAPAPDLS
jgi:putative transposase